MSLLRRSIGFSMLDKYLGQALTLLTTVVMARLITPAETGLFVVAQAIIMLADNFRDFGIGAYLVQSPDLDRAKIRSAFTVSLCLSLVMALALVGSADWIAALYANDPADAEKLRRLLFVACIGFAAVPFGSPVLALLRREMAFRSLAVINVIIAVINAAVTIWLGMLGWGAAAFMWAYVASNIVLVGLLFQARPDTGLYRPSIRAASEIMRFGLTSASVTVVNMAYDLIPRLWFGRVLGLDAVGLYARATTLCQLPDRLISQGLQPVLLPAFAARRREGGDLGAGWLSGVRLITCLHWPALLVLALLADPIVALLLGAQWTAVAPLLRFMAIATMAMGPACLTFPLLVAAGRIRSALYATLISLPPSAAILILAAPHGLQVVAVSLLMVMPFQMGVAMFFIMRATGLHLHDIVGALRQSAVVTLFAAAVPLVMALTAPADVSLSIAQALWALPGAVIGWCVGVVASGHPVGEEMSRVIARLRGLQTGA